MHVALEAGVRRAVGIECVISRHQIACHSLQESPGRISDESRTSLGRISANLGESRATRSRAARCRRSAPSCCWTRPFSALRDLHPLPRRAAEAAAEARRAAAAVATAAWTAAEGEAAEGAEGAAMSRPSTWTHSSRSSFALGTRRSCSVQHTHVQLQCVTGLLPLWGRDARPAPLDAESPRISPTSPRISPSHTSKLSGVRSLASRTLQETPLYSAVFRCMCSLHSHPPRLHAVL